MASLYPKKVGGKTYWYLREMGRVDGKPKMISERYLGTAADVAAAMETRRRRRCRNGPGTWPTGTSPLPGESWRTSGSLRSSTR